MNLVDAVGKVLHEHRIFSGMSEWHEELIAACASLVTFPAGTSNERSRRIWLPP